MQYRGATPADQRSAIFPLPGDIDVVELAVAVERKLPVGRSPSAPMGDSLYLLRASCSRDGDYDRGRRVLEGIATEKKNNVAVVSRLRS